MATEQAPAEILRRIEADSEPIEETAMATDEGRGPDTTEVVLLVCVKCGWEAQFEGGERPPENLTCEKCGGEVFRRFDDTVDPSEARAEFEEETGRDMDTNDPPTDTERGDLLDLNNP